MKEIKVYAELAGEYLTRRGTESGLSDKAVDYFRFFNEVGLTLEVDEKTGEVINVRLND